MHMKQRTHNFKELIGKNHRNRKSETKTQQRVKVEIMSQEYVCDKSESWTDINQDRIKIPGFVGTVIILNSLKPTIISWSSGKILDFNGQWVVWIIYILCIFFS